MISCNALRWREINKPSIQKSGRKTIFGPTSIGRVCFLRVLKYQRDPPHHSSSLLLARYEPLNSPLRVRLSHLPMLQACKHQNPQYSVAMSYSSRLRVSVRRFNGLLPSHSRRKSVYPHCDRFVHSLGRSLPSSPFKSTKSHQDHPEGLLTLQIPETHPK